MKYSVRAHGNIYRSISAEKQFALLGCTVVLSPAAPDAAQKASIEFEYSITAKNEPFLEARYRLDELVSILTYVLKCQIDTAERLDLECEGEQETVGLTSLDATGSIIGGDLGPNDDARVARVASVLQAGDEPRIVRTLRWYRAAQAEKDAVDKYIKMWVALEALAGRQPQGKVAARIISELKRIKFEGRSYAEICASVDTAYDLRKDLLHEGEIKPAEVANKTPELTRMVACLLDSIFEF